jgi:hypothetical protein
MPHVHHPFCYYCNPEAAAGQLLAVLASEDVCPSVGGSAGIPQDEVGEVSRCPLQPQICAGRGFRQAHSVLEGSIGDTEGTRE